MTMDFEYGEHPTHESIVNISEIWSKGISYGIDLKTGTTDMSWGSKRCHRVQTEAYNYWFKPHIQEQ